jgi:hypothetical protein
MCVIKAGYRVAEKRFVAIPLLPPPPDKDAMSKFVVDTLCSNRACRYRRDGAIVQSLAQCTRSCGNPSCFYQSCHVVLVMDPPAELYRVVLDVYKG